MKRITVLIIGLLLNFLGYAQQVNDPNAEVRDAKGFHAINVSNAFDVYISQGNDEAVAVSAAEVKYRERITVEVKEGVLIIGYDKQGLWNNGNKKLKAYISVKDIDKLTVSGACDVFIVGTLKASSLTVNQSGASDLKGKIEVQKLSIDLSGASDVTISGTATEADIDVSGASSFRGYDLVTDNCGAKASGASDIRVTVNKELSAHASGASDIHYKGDGAIRDVKSSGASSVNKRS